MDHHHKMKLLEQIREVIKDNAGIKPVVNKKKTILKKIKKDGMNLQFASESLKNNKKMIKIATKNNFGPFWIISWKSIYYAHVFIKLLLTTYPKDFLMDPIYKDQRYLMKLLSSPIEYDRRFIICSKYKKISMDDSIV